MCPNRAQGQMKTMGIDKKEIEEWARYWEPLFRVVPEARADAVKAWGEQMQKEVRRQVTSRGVQDSREHVRLWQEMRMGSRGGWVAVSPRSGKAGTAGDGRVHTWKGKTVTASQVTRWLERGHGNRQRHFGTRFNTANAARYTRGHLFYSWAEMIAEREALKAADDALCRIADEVDY